MTAGRVVRELPPADTGLAFAAMQELRSGLVDESSFVRHVDAVQRPQGYRLVAAFSSAEAAAPVAVAGFRIGDNLAWGRFLYVDDLSTVPDGRRQGHGRALLAWLAEEGRRHGCREMHLDSGVGTSRADAHRLYLNAGLVIASHHFARPL